jgi:uncharacterized membrane protein
VPAWARRWRCKGLAGARFALRFTPGFWKRWAQIAGCAALVSVGSALMFPRSWISFGVLHGMAVMLILARLASPLRAWLWPLGALCIALPRIVQHRFFDQPFSHWVGLVTHKPITEDWVPVLPWLGVMLWGLALGQWLLQRHPAVLAGAVPAAAAPPGRAGALEPELLHAAPAVVHRRAAGGAQSGLVVTYHW